MPYKISIIGSGNMAHCLAQKFVQAGHQIHEIWARDSVKSAELAKTYAAFVPKNLSAIDPLVDILLLAVSDASIEIVANQIPETKAVIAHCAGAADIALLQKKGHAFTGVFYPIQTISGQPFPDFTEVPICVEGSAKEAEQLLFALAGSISNKVLIRHSEQRLQLHLAAVFVNNFGNVLFEIAEGLLKTNGDNLKILEPLMIETVRNAIKKTPKSAQTGPAKRGDEVTMKKHLKLLAENNDAALLYALFSKIISKNYPS